jgi:hypothetical protein
MAKSLTVPVLIGRSQDALQSDYRINATPATYLLDENGKIMLHQDGYKPGDEKTLEARIEAALNPLASGSTIPPECPLRP